MNISERFSEKMHNRFGDGKKLKKNRTNGTDSYGKISIDRRK